jgi:hypothetical protein
VWEGGSEEQQQQEEEEGVIHRARARRCMLGQVGARWEYGNPFLIGFAGNLWERASAVCLCSQFLWIWISLIVLMWSQNSLWRRGFGADSHFSVFRVVIMVMLGAWSAACFSSRKWSSH